VKELKKTEAKKHSLNKHYNEWRKISWEAKDYKLKILNKINEILEFIEKTDAAFAAQLRIRIAYSAPKEEYQIAEKQFLKVVEKEELFADQTDILETTYEGLGDLYFEAKQYDKASDIYIKLFEINRIVDFFEEDILQMGIAMLNHSKGIYHDKAEELLLFVYNSCVCDEKMDHLMATEVNYNLGLVKYKLRKYKEAKPYLEKALVLYKQRKWDYQNINNLLNNIADYNDSKPIAAPYL